MGGVLPGVAQGFRVILLDTHTVVWISTDKRLLSPLAAQSIRNANRVGGGLGIASSTLWEIAMMTQKGRFRLPKPLAEYLRHVESAFVVLPITSEIAYQSMRFSERYPGDPTDRLIGATALVHGLQLVTRDKAIRASREVDCVW